MHCRAGLVQVAAWRGGPQHETTGLAWLLSLEHLVRLTLTWPSRSSCDTGSEGWIRQERVHTRGVGRAERRGKVEGSNLSPPRRPLSVCPLYPLPLDPRPLLSTPITPTLPLPSFPFSLSSHHVPYRLHQVVRLSAVQGRGLGQRELDFLSAHPSPRICLPSERTC